MKSPKLVGSGQQKQVRLAPTDAYLLSQVEVLLDVGQEGGRRLVGPLVPPGRCGRRKWSKDVSEPLCADGKRCTAAAIVYSSVSHDGSHLM